MKVFNNLIESFKAFGIFRESISVFSSSLNLDTAKIIASKATPSVLSFELSTHFSISSGSLIANSIFLGIFRLLFPQNVDFQFQFQLFFSWLVYFQRWPFLLKKQHFEQVINSNCFLE